MRRLFWRIFLSFWLLLVAVTLMLVALDPGLLYGPSMLHRLAADRPPPPVPPGASQGGGLDHPPGQPPPPGPDDGSPANGGPAGPPGFGGGPGGGQLTQHTLRLLDSSGVTAVNQFFDDTEHRTGLKLTLLDSQLRVVAGEAPDPSVRRLAQQALANGPTQLSPGNGVFENADPAYDSDGNEYVMIEIVEPPSIDYAALAGRVAAVIAIATLVCWWLSRQITLPIVALRIAARDLAAGRLHARVKPLMEARNDELGGLATDFDQMAARLEGMVAEQTRLLADVSHELRSPLARLGLASAIARRNAPGRESAQALDRVDLEVARLNELIGQLMLVSKLEVDGARRDDREVDLSELVAEICADAAFEAESECKTIELKPGLHQLCVSGNRELLRSAIENVVRNAVRYTAAGTSVAVELSQVAGMAVVNIRDHGLGVADAELADIFKPFYRTAAARDRETGGVGLGLAITKRAVIRHGGRVMARNAADIGLVVRIELPIRQKPGW